MIHKGPNVEIFPPSNISIQSWVDEGGIAHEGELFLGEHTHIQPFVSVVVKKRIEIGKNCSIAPGVQIYDHDHNLEDIHDIQTDGKIAPVKIGDYCWIGANAVILKGVTLGDYCVVGAGAIVTKSFPDRSIVVGNPARLLRTREECTNPKHA